jgi:hypothetical protein
MHKSGPDRCAYPNGAVTHKQPGRDSSKVLPGLCGNTRNASQGLILLVGPLGFSYLVNNLSNVVTHFTYYIFLAISGLVRRRGAWLALEFNASGGGSFPGGLFEVKGSSRKWRA